MKTLLVEVLCDTEKSVFADHAAGFEIDIAISSSGDNSPPTPGKMFVVRSGVRVQPRVVHLPFQLRSISRTRSAIVVIPAANIAKHALLVVGAFTKSFGDKLGLCVFYAIP